jgi:hypothetical protein
MLRGVARAMIVGVAFLQFPWPSYQPVAYTAAVVMQGPVWADKQEALP